MPDFVADEKATSAIDWQQTDLYRFFAFVFAFPTRLCFDLLAQPEMSAALRDLWRRLKCEGEFPGFEWFPSYELYESAYIALFDVAVSEPPVALFESAHDKSRPAQGVALENTYFYGILGLSSDSTRAFPDYLITQLEFLAALSFTQENTLDDSTAHSLAKARSDFLERHLLNWVDIASAKLGRTDAPGFPVLMGLLVRFLCRERDTLTSLSK